MENITEEIKGESSIIVYLVIDKNTHGMINYFRECGIQISNIYNNVSSARDEVLMQHNKCRIIVADTGQGQFISTKNRQELIDMLGICDDNNRVTVFYTDSALKIDTIRELGKSKEGIDWFKYKGTADMVATILKYKERYKLDSNIDEYDGIPDDSEILSVKGIKSELSFGDIIDVPWASSDNIIKNILESNSGEILKKYEVEL